MSESVPGRPPIQIGLNLSYMTLSYVTRHRRLRTQMLRMGKLTDYATVVLASLAQEPARHRAAAELAERTRLSRPTVSKVLKGLQRAGMVISSRGAQGGYKLARRPENITATQILDVFEGPIAITECSGASSRCGIERQCRVGAGWQRVNAAIRRALDDVTLHQLAGLDSAEVRLAPLATPPARVPARIVVPQS